MQRLIIKKRLHLNKWYNRLYLLGLICASWYNVSYFSALNWFFATFQVAIMGVKFIQNYQIKIFRAIVMIQLGFLFVYISVLFIWIVRSSALDPIQDAQLNELLVYSFKYKFGNSFFGSKLVFWCLIDELILNVAIFPFGLITLVNLQEPKEQGVIVEQSPIVPLEDIGEQRESRNEDMIMEFVNDQEFTLDQQRIAYERAMLISFRYMVLLVIMIILNESIITLLLTVSLVIVIGVNVHVVERKKRFRVGRIANSIVSLTSFIFLNCFIYVSLFDSRETTGAILLGTFTLNKSLTVMGITIMSIFLICSVRTAHYEFMIEMTNLTNIEREIFRQGAQSAFQWLPVWLCQNYFGFIIVLSAIWITHQMSLLRGVILLMILYGLLKRQRFKARKKWQTSLGILYIAIIQMFILLFFNIPFKFNENLQENYFFTIIGLYNIPQYRPEIDVSLPAYFWKRTSDIMIDIGYVLILFWLIKSQQTLDEKRHLLIIDDLVKKQPSKRQSIKEDQGWWSSIQDTISSLYLQTIRTIILNFDKLVIFSCMFISLMQADIFRACFLVFFILYAFVDKQGIKKYSTCFLLNIQVRLHITIILAVLYILYTSQVLFSFRIKILSNIALFFGMKEFSQDPNTISFFFIKQFFDIFVCVGLLIFQIQVVNKTETVVTYTKQLDLLNISQSSDDSSQYECDDAFRPSSEEKLKAVKIFNTLDPLRQFFIEYGLLICQFCMLMIAFIPPANLLSLVYIFYYQILLYLHYTHNDTKTVAQLSIKSLKYLIIINVIILVLRYLYTIEFVNYIILLIIEEQTFLSDLGMDPHLNTVKLIGNGILLQLLNSYRLMYYSRWYRLLEAYSDDLKHEESKRIFDHRSWSYFWYKWKVKLSVLTIYHLQKVILVLAFYIAVWQRSYLGMIFACMLFLVIWREIDNNWVKIAVPVMVIIVIQVLVQYTFQTTLLLQLMQGEETIEWMGILSQDEFSYWELMIWLHFCEALPLLYSLSEYFASETFKKYGVTPSSRELLFLPLWKEFLQSLLPAYHQVRDRRNKRQQFQEEEDEDFSQDQDLVSSPEPSQILQEEQEGEAKSPEERFERMKRFYEPLRKKQKYAAYLESIPFYQTLSLISDADKFFTAIGLEVCLFIMVITAYYQRNFFSVFYIVVASGFANFSHNLAPSSYRVGVKRFKWAWIILCLLMMVEVIRRYLILQWFPSSWDVRQPWWYYSYACNSLGKGAFNEDDPNDNTSDFMKCQADWNYWLSLSGYKSKDIWVTFISFFFCMVFLRHFKTIERKQQKQQESDLNLDLPSVQAPSAPSIQSDRFSDLSIQDPDKNDFTYSNNRKQISHFLKFYVFCYFYKIALLVFLLIGVSSDISQYTELISCIYFFTAINLLFLSSKLEQQKHKIWDRLILFNTIVMMTMSLYQAPFVPCPIIYKEGRYYYDNTECVITQQTDRYYNSDFFIFLQDEFQQLASQAEGFLENDDIHQSFKEVNTFDVTYMFASHLFGLNKTLEFHIQFSRETLMALFFFLGLLQRNIWSHPYTKRYVGPYLKRQQEKYKQSAIHTVEGIHLRRTWDFKYVQTQKDCHDSMQARVSERVRKWDEFFQFDADYKRKSFFYGMKVEQELNKRRYKPDGQIRMLRFEEENEPQIVRQSHTSFTSDDFEQLQKTNPEIVIRAEEIVQDNKSPVIQLYDACSIVRASKGSPEMMVLLIEELKLKEERSVLEFIYLNEPIGLFKYYEQTIQVLEKEAQELNIKKEALMKKLSEQKVEVQILKDNSDDESEERKSVVRRESNQEEDEEEKSLLDSDSVSLGQKKKEIFEPLVVDQDSEPSPTTQETQQQQLWLKQWIRELLISVLTTDTYLRSSVVRRQHIDRQKLSILFFWFLAHYFVVVCVLLMVVNTCINANIVALVFPLSAFLYGMVENPLQTKGYWNFLLWYIIIEISAKFLYQMPIFCDSPPYTLIGMSDEFTCEARIPTVSERISRIDYVIGIRKFNNETFISAIMIDLVLFICFLIQRFLMQSQGIWDYIHVSRDQYFIPQFYEEKHQETKLLQRRQELFLEPGTATAARLEAEEDDDFSEREKLLQERNTAEPTWSGQLMEMNQESLQQLIKFIYRVFPTFLPVVYLQRQYVQKQDKKYNVENKESIMFPEQIKTGRDLYVPGFIICLLILLYFLLFFPNIVSKRSYAHITQGSQQRFSSEVIFVILMIIVIIVVDRILFIIRKVSKNPDEMLEEGDQQGGFCKYTLLIKASMHLFLIIIVHYYFFFVIPRKTNRRFQESPYLIFAYLIISIYFLISAVQIRYGYPVTDLVHFFKRSKDTFHYYAFALYRAIPFLYELRIIIDWTFTTTSLELIQWFKLEDIYANLYMCSHYMLTRQKHQLGHRRKKSEKCLGGCLFAFFLIIVLVLPILIFSSLNPAVEINNLVSGRMQIKAEFTGPDDQLFFTLFSVNDVELLPVQPEQFKKIQKVYGEIESSWQERMQRVRVKRFSDTEWRLPDNYRDQIRKMIKSQDYEVFVECSWAFQKNDLQGGFKQFRGENTISAHESFVSNFGKILAPKSPDATFVLENLIPKFLYVGDSADTEVLRLEPVNIRTKETSYYQSVKLIHRKTSDQVYFEISGSDSSEDLKEIGSNYYQQKIKFLVNDSQKVEFFVLNELSFGSIVGALSNNVSIVGIYVTFVLAVGRFLRLTYDKISMRVMYEDMPNVSELFDLCQSLQKIINIKKGIFIARIDGNLIKEEIFYELLIRIYRSPEILFKMTGNSIYDNAPRR